MISSGIRGLDVYVLRGGFPVGNIIAVVGEPGVGKTIFAFQFLIHGAEQGERVLYLSTDEPPDRVLLNVRGLGWDIDKYIDSGLLLVPPEVYDRASRSFDDYTILFKGYMDRYPNITRVVIDSISTVPLPEQLEGRSSVEILRDFLNFLRSYQDTTYLLICREGWKYEHALLFEADGVIRMYREYQRGRMVVTHYIEVVKMRGAYARTRIRVPYEIKPVTEPPYGVAIRADWTAGEEEEAALKRVGVEERKLELIKRIAKARLSRGVKYNPRLLLKLAERTLDQELTADLAKRFLVECGYDAEEVERIIQELYS